MSRTPSFGQLLVAAFASHWLNVGTVAVRKLAFVTFLWGVVAMLVSVVATLTTNQATFAPYGRLSAIIFFGLLTASWIVVAITQIATNDAGEQTSRHQLAAGLTALPTIIIAALLTWSTVSLTFADLMTTAKPAASDYASCTANGGLVLQTNPAQCITTTNTFTDPAGVK